MNCKVWTKTKGQERREIIWLSTKECDRKWISSRYLESYWGSDHIKSSLPSKGVFPWSHGKKLRGSVEGYDTSLWKDHTESISDCNTWRDLWKQELWFGSALQSWPWSPLGVSSCGAWVSRSPRSGLVTDGWLYCWWKQLGCGTDLKCGGIVIPSRVRFNF